MTLKDYDSVEEAYQDGYKNGKLVGALEASGIMIEKIKGVVADPEVEEND